MAEIVISLWAERFRENQETVPLPSRVEDQPRPFLLLFDRQKICVGFIYLKTNLTSMKKAPGNE